ncbi:hypothetical protein BC828DRAFT_393900 [Blastocladiella britannica]|nr:hypothetical protein BC828DRAFT_393900 [Blastocladiella britannica]
MTESIPLSVLVKLPWEELRYDTDLYQILWPLTLGLTIGIALLSATVIITAFRDPRLRAEIIAFASNGLFLLLCIGNFLHMTLAACMHIFVRINGGRWPRSFCNINAAMNVFFPSLSNTLNFTMTTERILMVVFLSRMAGKHVVLCGFMSIVLAASNTFSSSQQGLFIYRSGFSCGYALPSWASFVDIGGSTISLVYLIVGNGYCYWRLHLTLQKSKRTTMLSSHAESIKAPTKSPQSTVLHQLAPKTREIRIQRVFAFRGVLMAMALLYVCWRINQVRAIDKYFPLISITVIPTAVIVLDWGVYDRLGSPVADVTAQFAIPLTALSELLIVLVFDNKFQSAFLAPFAKLVSRPPAPPRSASSPIVWSAELSD